jgi:hypothetical protein
VQAFWRERLRRLEELRLAEADRQAHLRFTRNYSARVIQRAWWQLTVRRVSKRVHFVERNKVGGGGGQGRGERDTVYLARFEPLPHDWMEPAG